MIVQLNIPSAIVQMFTVNFYTLNYCECYVFYFKAEYLQTWVPFQNF